MTDPVVFHPDDDALSAWIDGEASASDRGHVDGCDACRARVARLEAVRAAVSTPVPPDQGAVTRSVHAALNAWDASSPAAVPIGARRRRYTPPAAWVGIAAIVLALLAAVPLLLRGTDRDLSASGGDTEFQATPLEGGSSGAGQAPETGATARSVNVADFGEHDDTATLVALLSTDRYAAPPAALAEDSAGDATASASDPASADQARCVEEGTRVAAGRAGVLVMIGPVVWRGTDAVVVVFAVDPDEAGHDRQLYVMSRDDCGVLAERRF